MVKVDMNHLERRAPVKSGRSVSGLRKWLSYDFSLRGQGLSLQKKQSFYSDLAVLLGSGIDIKTAFDIIIGNARREKERILFELIRQRLVGGSALSAALAASPGWSVYETVSVRIGEESGNLPEVLNELEKYYSRRIAQNRKITGAFSYPFIVMLTAMAAVFFMMRFVVPMFEDVFARFNGELPWITRAVIAVSHNMGRYMAVFFLITVTMIIVVLANRNRAWFRRISAAVLLRIPVFGPMALKMHLARFCLSTELLIRAQTPLQQALALAGNMVTFYPMQLAIRQMEKDIIAGMPLNQSMAQFRVFESRLVSLVKVGEEVNKLAPMLARLRNIYDDEIDHRSAMISTVMEPLIIIIIGMVVGLVLVSMYLPMFKMSTVMAQ